MRSIFALYIIAFFFCFSCKNKPAKRLANVSNKNVNTIQSESNLKNPGEVHFANIRQLTSGGNNAEAYLSFDDKMVVFQSDNPEWGVECDQIFYFNLKKDKAIPLNLKPKMLSTGFGRTTCSFFMPGDSTVLYAGTQSASTECPPVPSHEQGYVWPIYKSYDIYVADLNGNIIDTLTHSPGYDAEATVSPQGDKIVFTSTRSGDLELWTMNIDGSDKTQITHELGYDGGAFFSPDGSKLVFRASRPKTDAERKEYKRLLKQGLIKPTELEIFVCNADGSNLRQVTHLGNANWAPYFHPGGEKIIFCSNYEAERGFPFNLYMINIDGTGLEQITFDDHFASFPMFSHDGEKLIFSSNRNNGGNHSTNVFIADWVE